MIGTFDLIGRITHLGPFRFTRGAVRSGAFRVFTDSSARGLGAMLGQLFEVCAATALPRRGSVAHFAPSFPYQLNVE
jgi:hypothetical protein